MQKNTLPARARHVSHLFVNETRTQYQQDELRRSAPFDIEPGFYKPAQLWLYGNVRLLRSKTACVIEALGATGFSDDKLKQIESEAEKLVLEGNTLVCGIHNDAHRRAAVVPLRWGSPRILVVSGGFKHHLGEDLDEEPFRAARLWRYKWDKQTDLIVSTRAPGKRPTFASHNPTVDRLIERLVESTSRADCTHLDPFGLAKCKG